MGLAIWISGCKILVSRAEPILILGVLFGPRGYQLGYQGCLEVANEEDGTRKNAVSNVFPLVEVARFELTTT
jgi:hypothetical protein